jgi:hypothetical protein
MNDDVVRQIKTMRWALLALGLLILGTLFYVTDVVSKQTLEVLDTVSEMKATLNSVEAKVTTLESANKKSDDSASRKSAAKTNETVSSDQ